MKTTLKELQQRIRDLEAELQYYMDIAATYRASLGDAQANTILLPYLSARRDRSERKRGNDHVDWRAALESLRDLTTEILVTRPNPKPTEL